MVRIQAIGGPTAILEAGGLRLLTDPTFDPPGDYPRLDGPTLVKLAPPALGPDDLGPVDVVLLSHDQHADNLDRSGRAYLARVPLTLTTPSSSARLAADGVLARALAPWDQVDLPRPDGGTLRSPPCPPGTGPRGANRSAAM